MKKLYIFTFLIFVVACVSSKQSRDFWINEKQNEKIYVQADGIENAKYHKLVFIQHGLASNKEHAAVQAAKNAFLKHNFVVITFDSRHSLGQGDNNVEKVRLSTFEQDLKTVVNWAKQQSFYSEPFALSGHSLGGASVIEYGAKHPQQVNILVSITPVISGNLWEKNCMQNLIPFCKEWKQNGSYEYTDPQNHKKAIIPYAVVNSSKQYNALALAPQIRAKTLLIAAETDIVINPQDLKALSEKINSASIKVINSSGHNFEEKQNQTDLYQTIDNFLK